MKRAMFYIVGGLLICSAAVNLVQIRRIQSHERNTVNTVMVGFAGPIIAVEGVKLKTPEETTVGKIGFLSQSVGALNAGMTTLDAVGVPHQYSYFVLKTNQLAIGALEGGVSTVDQQKLAKWVNFESSLLNTYETQKNLPNISLLKEIFKEIYDAAPVSKS